MGLANAPPTCKGMPIPAPSRQQVAAFSAALAVRCTACQAPQPAEASGDGERQRQREVWQGLVAPPG
jgi:hypothetical protein